MQKCLPNSNTAHCKEILEVPIRIQRVTLPQRSSLQRKGTNGASQRKIALLETTVAHYCVSFLKLLRYSWRVIKAFSLVLRWWSPLNFKGVDLKVISEFSVQKGIRGNFQFDPRQDETSDNWVWRFWPKSGTRVQFQETTWHPEEPLSPGWNYTCLGGRMIH